MSGYLQGGGEIWYKFTDVSNNRPVYFQNTSPRL